MEKKLKGSRSWSRILAIQALYQINLNKHSKYKLVIKDLLNNKETKKKADDSFFSKLVIETIKNEKKLINKLLTVTGKNKFQKMEVLIKVILKLGTCELLFFKNIPSNASISEYTKASSSFLSKKEVGLINGILDKISKS